MNWALTLAFCLCLVAWPLFVHEKARYSQALRDCTESYARNEHTLSRDVCANVAERERCSESIRQSCLQAERDNRVSPAECARHRWFAEGEWAGLYARLAGSTITLVTLVCVLTLGGVYIFAMYRSSENTHKRMVDTFHRDFRHLRNPSPGRLRY